MKYILLLMLSIVSMQSLAMVEPLYGISVGESTIKIKVTSNGCTTEKDFELMIRHHRLVITRTKMDNCRARAKLVELIFPLRDTLKKPKLYNPIFLSLEPVFAKNSSH